jgi:hypothetical protein
MNNEKPYHLMIMKPNKEKKPTKKEIMNKVFIMNKSNGKPSLKISGY